MFRGELQHKNERLSDFELEQRVEKAYTNRAFVVLSEDRLSVREVLERSIVEGKRMKGLRVGGMNDEEVILQFVFSPKLIDAWVEDIGDYKRLLRLACKRIYPWISEEEIRATVASDLRHELPHVVRIYKYPTLSDYYGARFFEDRESGVCAYQPAIGIEGSVSLAGYKDILSAPSELSTADFALLEELWK